MAGACRLESPTEKNTGFGMSTKVANGGLRDIYMVRPNNDKPPTGINILQCVSQEHQCR